MIKLTNTLLALSLLLFAGLVHSQVNITPGIGFHDLKIGMKYDAFTAVVGESNSVLTYAEEEKNYTDNGYEFTQTLPFLIGFDAVYVYTNNNQFGIWKAYFKKGKLVYLNLSSYVTSTEISTKITVKDSLQFFQGVEQMETVLGKEYVKAIDPDNYVVYTYTTVGIRFLYEGTKLRGIYIFKPLKGKKATRLNALLAPITE